MMTPIELKGTVSVEIHPIQSDMGSALMTDFISANVSITMGADIQHFEGTTTPGSNTVSMNHTFKPIQNRYTRQGPDPPTPRLQSYVLVWVHLLYVRDGVSRSMLVGTKAIKLKTLVRSLIHSPHHPQPLRCDLNTAGRSHADVTFTPSSEADAVESMRELETWLLDHSTEIQESPFDQLETTNRLVMAQLGLLHSCLAGGGIDKNIIMPSMMYRFLCSKSTMETSRFAACYTDMTDIVRSRTVAFPLQFLLHNMFAACSVQGIYNPVEFMTEAPSIEVCKNMLLGVLNSVPLDKVQGNYYNDYELHGAVVQDSTLHDPAYKGVQVKVVGTGDHAERSMWIQLVGCDNQRQICTGINQGTVIFGDDCETNGLGAFGTSGAIRNLVLRIDGVPTVQEWVTNAVGRQGALKAQLPPEVQVLVDDIMPLAMWRDPTHHTSNKVPDRVAYIVLLYHVAKRVEHKLEYGYGTLRSESGKPPGMHCFVVAKLWDECESSLQATRHLIDETLPEFWQISRHDRECEPLAEVVVCKLARTLSELLAIYTAQAPEGGRTPHPRFAVSEREVCKCIDEVFIVGNSAVAYRKSTVKTPAVQDTKVQPLVCGMKTIDFIHQRYKEQERFQKVKYALLGLYASDKDACHADKDACASISATVRDTAQAERVPGWSERKWDTFFAALCPPSIEYTSPNPTRVGNSNYIRCIFMHEVPERNPDGTDQTDVISSRVVNSIQSLKMGSSLVLERIVVVMRTVVCICVAERDELQATKKLLEKAMGNTP
jgi:hypothetical protein